MGQVGGGGGGGIPKLVVKRVACIQAVKYHARYRSL